MTKMTGNEPAFPLPRLGEVVDCDSDSDGMTVRTYLAVRALIGILSNATELEDVVDCGELISDEAASRAVMFADALIAELNKPRGDKTP